MIQVRLSSLTDIADVLANASDITREELHTVGVQPWAVLKLLREQGLDNTETAFDEHGPLYIFRHRKMAIGRERETTFLATQRYFDMGARGVLFARRHLSNIERFWPGTMFVANTYSSHPDVARWFSLLGFFQARDMMGKTLYILDPNVNWHVTKRA